MTFPSRLRWLVLTFVIVIFDRYTKMKVETPDTPAGWRHEVIHNFIYIVHSVNPGIAFSMFADSESPFLRYSLIALSFVFIVVLVWLLLSSKSATWRTLSGLALLIGGAAGNLTDRIFHGGVTDFFEVWFGSYRYPAFNLADSAIAVGAILVLLDVLFPPKHPANPH